jgi:hypothetical protein
MQCRRQDSREPEQKQGDNSVPAQGRELPRPIGMKKAKKLEKVQSSAAKASIDSGRTSGNVTNEFLADMSAVTKDLVAAFKANTIRDEESVFTSTSVDNPEIPSAIKVGDTTTT